MPTAVDNTVWFEVESPKVCYSIFPSPHRRSCHFLTWIWTTTARESSDAIGQLSQVINLMNWKEHSRRPTIPMSSLGKLLLYSTMGSSCNPPHLAVCLVPPGDFSETSIFCLYNCYLQRFRQSSLQAQVVAFTGDPNLHGTRQYY